MLRLSLVPLVCSARLWRVFGAAGGDRRPYLLRRLGEMLAYSEREIRAGEAPLLVSHGMIARASRDAQLTIDALQDGRADRAATLDALDRATVQLSSLASRIATTLIGSGEDEPRTAGSPPRLDRRLHAVFDEVTDAAGACLASPSQEASERVGIWLSDALRAVPSATELALAGCEDRDRCLRIDGLFSLRASWLSLAARLWLLAQDLDELLAIGSFDDEQRLRESLAARAARTLIASGVTRRPHQFDHAHASVRHREELGALTMLVCRALGSEDADAVIHAQQLALARVARVLGALWCIDQSVLGADRPGDRTPLRARRARTADSYDARLVRCILGGERGAPRAAMALLERRDPASLHAAAGLVADHGTLTVEAFDCLADAWGTYRHLRHLGWD